MRGRWCGFWGVRVVGSDVYAVKDEENGAVPDRPSGSSCATYFSCSSGYGGLEGCLVLKYCDDAFVYTGSEEAIYDAWDA